MKIKSISTYSAPRKFRVPAISNISAVSDTLSSRINDCIYEKEHEFDAYYLTTKFTYDRLPEDAIFVDWRETIESEAILLIAETEEPPNIDVLPKRAYGINRFVRKMGHKELTEKTHDIVLMINHVSALVPLDHPVIYFNRVTGEPIPSRLDIWKMSTPNECEALAHTYFYKRDKTALQTPKPQFFTSDLDMFINALPLKKFNLWVDISEEVLYTDKYSMLISKVRDKLND